MEADFRLVIVESPFAAETPEGREANLAYGRACLADCLSRNESPIASHLLLTQPGVLDDSVPAQRARGIEAGLAWLSVVDACVVYLDHGMSGGMQRGVDAALRAGVPVEYRKLQVRHGA